MISGISPIHERTVMADWKTELCFKTMEENTVGMIPQHILLQKFQGSIRSYADIRESKIV